MTFTKSKFNSSQGEMFRLKTPKQINIYCLMCIRDIHEKKKSLLWSVFLG